MEETREIIGICAVCGEEITEDDCYSYVGNDIVCETCADEECGSCDHCGELVYNNHAFYDENHFLCPSCFHGEYVRCCHCDAIIHVEDANYANGECYCDNCYEDEEESHSIIHDYSYKPEPIFKGHGNRYFGVELEIDGAGKDDDYAEELLEIANRHEENLYIKTDGSLDDGMELVSHPMSLAYHKGFCWNEIMHTAKLQGYRSHNTSTCGLHIHVNRNCLGNNADEQDEVISRILFFVEKNWNELLKFSRRSEYNMNRWAARYGFEKTGREILSKAKKGNNGRYAAVNLCNYATIEFRMFRGTLKYNTFIATLELVNLIVDTALNYSETELQKLSWSEFVEGITEAELITYLKERSLYINEKVVIEQEEV